MNPKELYNSWVDKIEDKIERIIERSSFVSSEKIVEEISIDSGFGYRELNAIFKFIIGQTLLEYIKERRLMHAYHYLRTENDPKISVAVEISGLEEQSSFNRKFKKKFGFSPKAATELKTIDTYTPAKTWDEASLAENYTFADKKPTKEQSFQTDIRFGMPYERYATIIEAYKLTEMYQLNPLYSNVAYELFEKTAHPLKQCFQYVDEIRAYGGDFDDEDYELFEETKDKTPEERFRDVVFDPFYQWMFFSCGLSATEANDIACKTGLFEEELMKLDPLMLKKYSETYNISLKYFQRAYEYYVKHSDSTYCDSDFEEYVDSISINIPMEEAFARLCPMGDEDDWYDVNDYRKCEAETFDDFDFLEREADEETYWHEKNIDDQGLVEDDQ